MAQLADSLGKYIESNALTPDQRAVCYGDGSFVVRACPGSGKTMTTATRFAWKIANWQSRHSGVAVLSFTNVAWKEIGRELVTLGLPSAPGWPHFLGTIDAFVNRHIFLPFGHTVMKCHRRPEVVHEGNWAWVSTHIHERRFGQCSQNGCSPLSFIFSADGGVSYRGPRRQPTSCQRTLCADLKMSMVRRGFALYTDAMYWGLRVLDNRSIRRAIASRFPEIIVDEAQDTSEVQFKIIEALADAGARIVLVGDPDQAIYEFHDARPDLFTAFASRWPTLPLSENFRSSQHICDATWMFSGLSSAATAAGVHRDCPVKPIFKVYAPGAEADLMRWFAQVIDELAIARAAAAVLARRHDLVASLQGISPTEWPERGISLLTKAFARAAVYRDAGRVSDAHDCVMWACLRLCFDRSSYGSRREAIEPIGERQWRRQTWRLLQDLPPSTVRLSNWGPEVAGVIERFLSGNGWPCTVQVRKTFCRCNHPSAQEPIAAFVLVAAPGAGITCKVIHQAKGETYDAVMVVCAPRRRRKPGDLEQWLFPEKHGPAERRTGYVAMTRPRRLLVLAIPDGTHLDTAKADQLAKCFDVLK